MKFEITSEDRDAFVIDIDGRHSDPITPLSPKDRERIERIREKYLKAGLIQEPLPEPPEPGNEAK